MKLFAALIIFTIALVGCQSENRANPRAYIEGKITKSSLEFQKITVMIESESTIVAETIPNNQGDFTLSGPLLSNKCSLIFNTKIKSFSASNSGSKISSDSLQILIPPGTTYVKFNQIVLK